MQVVVIQYRFEVKYGNIDSGIVSWMIKDATLGGTAMDVRTGGREEKIYWSRNKDIRKITKNIS